MDIGTGTLRTHEKNYKGKLIRKYQKNDLRKVYYAKSVLGKKIIF